MDHRFREDENELPYLLSEKRDIASPSKSRPKISVNDILDSMDLPLSRRIPLEEKLVSFLNAKDCVGLRVEDEFYACNFIFTRRNSYVTTTDTFIYSTEFSPRKRVFHDCYPSHDHSRLLKDKRFQDMIKRTGMEFVDCSGGYVTEYSGREDEFTMRDEINVRVIFSVGSEKRMYKLDLDSMEIDEKYFKY